MKTMFNDKNIQTIEDIKQFLRNSELINIRAIEPINERAKWIRGILFRFKYNKLNKKKKRIVRKYLEEITGLKTRTIKYHVTAYKNNNRIRKPYNRTKFAVKYTLADKELLAETDNLHGRLNGISTKIICKNMFERGNERYENLAQISVAHLYNLRKTNTYKNVSTTVSKTQSVERPIGERKKPIPNGKPGYIRVGYGASRR